MDSAVGSFAQAGFGFLYISSLFVALPIGGLLTLILLARFRSRVAELMRTRIAADPKAPISDSPLPGASDASELELQLIPATRESARAAASADALASTRRAARRAAAVYLISSCALPLALVAVFASVIDHEDPLGWILHLTLLFLVNSTPPLLACMTALGGRLRSQLLAVLVLVGVLWALDSSIQTHAVWFWMLASLVPTVAVLLLSTRRLRAVGPGVCAATALVVCGIGAGQLFGWRYVMYRLGVSWETLAAVYSPFLEKLAALPPAEQVVLLREFVDKPTDFVYLPNAGALTTALQLQFYGISLVAALLGVGGAWYLIRWLSYRYETRRASDMMIRVDVLMFIFTFLMSLAYTAVAGWYAAWGLTGFAAYWLLSRWCIRRQTDAVQPRPRTLVLLRVFGFARRTQNLLEDLQQRWRSVGTINLIAGADVAYTTVELYEFLEFLGRRLDRAFVRSRDDLERHLSETDGAPDPDGRYRIHDFFCYENTWRMTVSALSLRTDVALMDLRGFTEANRGCVFEIEQLLAAVDPRRIVLAIDDSTDLALLRETLQVAWQKGSPERPDRGSGKRSICLLQASANRRHTIDTLMGLLDARVGA